MVRPAAETGPPGQACSRRQRRRGRDDPIRTDRALLRRRFGALLHLLHIRARPQAGSRQLPEARHGQGAAPRRRRRRPLAGRQGDRGLGRCAPLLDESFLVQEARLPQGGPSGHVCPGLEAVRRRRAAPSLVPQVGQATRASSRESQRDRLLERMVPGGESHVRTRQARSGRVRRRGRVSRNRPLEPERRG